MKLEDQVVSLELAKRLKELGVKQESLFYYRAWENPLNGSISEDKVIEDFWLLYYCDEKYSKSCDWEISAYTVAELGTMLREFELTHKYYEIDHYNTYDDYNLVLKTTKQLNIPNLYVRDYTEANARARMLIHLMENELI